MQVKWTKTFFIWILERLYAFVETETYDSVVRNDKGYSSERWKRLRDTNKKTFTANNSMYSPMLFLLHT